MTTPAQFGNPPRTLTPAGSNAGNAAVNTQAELSPSAIPPGMVAAANNTAIAYRYLLAYAFIVIFVLLITKSRVGYVIVYYSLLLMVVFVFVTQSGWVTWILTPITQWSQRAPTAAEMGNPSLPVGTGPGQAPGPGGGGGGTKM